MTPTTESPTGTSPPVADQAQEKLQEGKEAALEQAANAKEQAKNAAQQAQERAREQVDQRTTVAGEQIKGHADDARSVAEQLRSQGKDGPAKLVEEAAQRAEGLGGYLTEANADRLVRDIESYARKNPWAVMAGGLALGFAASRMVSAASASRELGTSTGSGNGTGPSAKSPARNVANPAADRPRAAADAAVGASYSGAPGVVPELAADTTRPPATADLPNYGGSPA